MPSVEHFADTTSGLQHNIAIARNLEWSLGPLVLLIMEVKYCIWAGHGQISTTMIHRLPNEILAHIFLQSSLDNSERHTPSGSPLLLCHVASFRRDLATSTPSLWAHLALEEAWGYPEDMKDKNFKILPLPEKVNLARQWLARVGTIQSLSLRLCKNSCTDDFSSTPRSRISCKYYSESWIYDVRLCDQTRVIRAAYFYDNVRP